MKKKWLKKKKFEKIYHKYIPWRIIVINTPTKKVFHDVGQWIKIFEIRILIDHQDFEERRCMTNNFKKN
jgi:hypothetical protein